MKAFVHVSAQVGAVVRGDDLGLGLRDSVPVARVSHRFSELRRSSASATRAMEAYQGTDQFAAIVHVNVSAQVAAATVGTSGDKMVAASECCSHAAT